MKMIVCVSHASCELSPVGQHDTIASDLVAESGQRKSVEHRSRRQAILLEAIPSIQPHVDLADAG